MQFPSSRWRQTPVAETSVQQRRGHGPRRLWCCVRDRDPALTCDAAISRRTVAVGERSCSNHVGFARKGYRRAPAATGLHVVKPRLDLGADHWTGRGVSAVAEGLVRGATAPAQGRSQHRAADRACVWPWPVCGRRSSGARTSSRQRREPRVAAEVGGRHCTRIHAGRALPRAARRGSPTQPPGAVGSRP